MLAFQNRRLQIMSPTRETSVRAHAKINLGLRVLYRRPDNFHEIRTVFQTISLFDEIRIAYTPARRTSISIDDALHIPGNLIERAAQACLDEWRHTAGIEFHLTKKI